MPDQEVYQHRVRGLVSGANWRATKFATPVPPHLTCGLCGVISRTTFLLPCFHKLCESCVGQSANDGNAVCPLDQQSFTVGDCPRFRLPPDTAEKLKAHCWNVSEGCTFVGTLQAVLTHYEEQCTFHVVTCPRCSNSVPHQDLPRHYRAECQGDGRANAADRTTLHQGLVLIPDDIAASLDELKALIRDPYHDSLPALQSKLNHVLEEARSIGTQIETVTRALTESEQRLAQALEEHSRMFFLKLQSLEAELRDNQSDAIARVLSGSHHRLSEQLAQSRRALTTTFGQELRSQLCEISASLTNMLELFGSNAAEAETRFGNEMPWKLEKRHILRKLELVAAESHASLEWLRQRANKRQKQPVAEVETFFAGHPEVINVCTSPFISQLENEDKRFVVTLNNVSNLIDSKKVVGLFTRWYRRHKYLQVAADGITPNVLSFYLKWGGTVQGSCSASVKAEVYLKHPDNPEKKNLRLWKASSVAIRAAALGFQDDFFAGIPMLHNSGYFNGDSLTLVVSFKK
ncbi:uncharacterized protein LOC144160081 [Haemaphysalis longicornis]